MAQYGQVVARLAFLSIDAFLVAHAVDAAPLARAYFITDRANPAVARPLNIQQPQPPARRLFQ